MSSTGEGNEKTKPDIPVWKRELLMKKEMDRYTSKNNVTAYSNLIIICRSEIDTAQQSRLMTAEERKKEKFDSLPEWKKKLILQKQSKLTHS